MPSPTDICPDRNPGPEPAGRRCVGTTEDGSRCTTLLHRRHGGAYCYDHAAPRIIHGSEWEESAEDFAELMAA